MGSHQRARAAARAKERKSEEKQKADMSQLRMFSSGRPGFKSTPKTQNSNPAPPCPKLIHSKRVLFSAALSHGHNLDLQAQLLQGRSQDFGELVGVHQAGPQTVVQMVALPRTHPGDERRRNENGGKGDVRPICRDESLI